MVVVPLEPRLLAVKALHLVGVTPPCTLWVVVAAAGAGVAVAEAGWVVEAEGVVGGAGVVGVAGAEAVVGEVGVGEKGVVAVLEAAGMHPWAG